MAGWGENQVIEIEDLLPKLDLAVKVASLAHSDICARCRASGIRWDNLRRSASHNDRFKLSTLNHIVHVFGIPRGVWFWSYEEFRKYLEDRR